MEHAIDMRAHQPDAVWGDLRRTEPFCRQFGFSRGTPVDRYYIERFLTEQRDAIRGRVGEIGDATYTRRFGGPQVTQSEVIVPPPGGRKATMVVDLASGFGVPCAVLDCFILTQTLEVIADPRAALRHALAMLTPGGTLLLTTGAIGHVSRYDFERWGDFRRFTPEGLRALLADVAGGSPVEVRAWGNAWAATAFLYGLAVEDAPANVLDRVDPRFAIVLSARVTRSEAST